jgi:hypothetical protein
MESRPLGHHQSEMSSKISLVSSKSSSLSSNLRDSIPAEMQPSPSLSVHIQHELPTPLHSVSQPPIPPTPTEQHHNLQQQQFPQIQTQFQPPPLSPHQQTPNLNSHSNSHSEETTLIPPSHSSLSNQYFIPAHARGATTADIPSAVITPHTQAQMAAISSSSPVFQISKFPQRTDSLGIQPDHQQHQQRTVGNGTLAVTQVSPMRIEDSSKQITHLEESTSLMTTPKTESNRFVVPLQADENGNDDDLYSMPKTSSNSPPQPITNPSLSLPNPQPQPIPPQQSPPPQSPPQLHSYNSSKSTVQDWRAQPPQSPIAVSIHAPPQQQQKQPHHDHLHQNLPHQHVLLSQEPQKHIHPQDQLPRGYRAQGAPGLSERLPSPDPSGPPPSRGSQGSTHHVQPSAANGSPSPTQSPRSPAHQTQNSQQHSNSRPPSSSHRRNSSGLMKTLSQLSSSHKHSDSQSLPSPAHPSVAPPGSSSPNDPPIHAPSGKKGKKRSSFLGNLGNKIARSASINNAIPSHSPPQAHAEHLPPVHEKPKMMKRGSLLTKLGQKQKGSDNGGAKGGKKGLSVCYGP